MIQLKLTRGNPNDSPLVSDVTLTYDILDAPYTPHAAATHYVRTDGNDANDGLANDSGHAWLTIDHAAICGVAGDTIKIVNVDGTSHSISATVNLWAENQTWEGISYGSGDTEEYPKISIEGEYNSERAIFETPCYAPYSAADYTLTFRYLHIKFNTIFLDQPRGFVGSYWGKHPQYLIYERIVFEGHIKPDSESLLPRAIYAVSYDTTVTVKFCAFKWMGYAISSGDYRYDTLKATNCIFYENYYDLYAIWTDPAIDSDYDFHYITIEEETNNATYATIGANSHCVLNGNEEDPLLVDVSAGDFHLQALSPCIDAADPAEDNGQQGTHWDAGAYERTAIPSVPAAINIQCESLTNPTGVTDSLPELSAEYDNPDTADVASSYQIQVIVDGGDFGSPLWDSGKTGCSVAEGSRLEIEYGGTALVLDGTKYYQRWKFWDASDAAGAWSDGTDYWVMATGQPAPVTRTGQEDVYAICQNLTGISEASEFLVGDVGMRLGKHKILLSEHPSLKSGQKIIRQRKRTGSPVIKRGYERLQGIRSPNTGWPFDANAYNLGLMFCLLFQNGVTETAMKKTILKYSNADCEIWSTLLRVLGTGSISHRMSGVIVKSLTLSAEEGGPLRASAELIGRELETDYDAGSCVLEFSDRSPLKWQDADVYLGGSQVYLPSYSLTINNHAFSKFYESQLAVRHLLGDLDVLGNFNLPWYTGATAQDRNVQVDDFISGTDKVFNIYWGHNTIGDLVAGDLSLKFNISYTGADLATPDEIVTECPFEMVDDEVNDPVEILVHDDTDRGIP